jgi:hypothetical protein
MSRVYFDNYWTDRLLYLSANCDVTESAEDNNSLTTLGYEGYSCLGT